ncbi:MAG: cytochrome c nitrite reductase small subunit [Ignavibacteriae bacterium]|nr:cytochrome c nitrite reductase small subunit [Ignavibacteriota bacterium]MCB9208176.1 cytochrome c nitrite reductase small subunit [Ignavibacteriales bacterium]MCB9258942.1 cytochrome c nitrite reductase small subunit [Ignavibacteriales bacterium]
MTENKKKSIIDFIIPPPSWKLPVTIIMGVLVGLIIYTFKISNAVSYLSDSPQTCVNCHVMYPEYASWERGSHGRVATCNDCHVPQDNIVRKYLFKASDGLRHASMFTFRMEPQVIRIKEAGIAAVQENCIRCHSNYLHPISLRSIDAKSIYDGSERLCWDCHRETPHGRVHSLSSAQNIIRPDIKPIVSDWILKNK